MSSEEARAAHSIARKLTDAELIDVCRDSEKWTPENISALAARMKADRGFTVKAFNAGAQAFNVSKAVYAGALSQKLEEVGAPSVFVIEDHDISDMELTKEGRVKGSFANYCKVIENESESLGLFKYNCLSGRVMNAGAFWEIDPHPVRDADIVNVRNFLSEKYGFENKDNVPDAIQYIANNRKYHPVRDELEALPAWDGVERIKDLFPKYLGAERSEYISEVTKLFLYGVIQRTYRPGIKFDICLILADRQQGTGKSTMCRLLALRDEWFTDELGDLGDSQKAYEAIRGKCVVEMGEMLVSKRTKDVESVKAYLTRTSDVYREPYGKYPESRPRQCVFIGTTNKSGFLPPDRSGNRRFFPVFCDGTRAEVHPLTDENETREFVRMCYAEALAIGKRDGFKLTFDKRLNKVLDELRDDGTPDDDLPGRIMEWLDTARDGAGNLYDVVCSRMVWEGINGQYVEPKKNDLQEVAEIMNGLPGWIKYSAPSGKYRFKKGYGPDFKGNGYGIQRAWQRVVDTAATGGNNDGFSELTAEEVKEIPFD